jgi:hypothetical protein
MRLPARKFRTYQCVGRSALQAAINAKNQYGQQEPEDQAASENNDSEKDAEAATTEVVEHVEKVE